MKVKLYILLLICLLSSCKKDWLSEKRDISVIVPTTLKDLRLLLNNELPLNVDRRAFMESSCDDFYVNKTQFDNITYVPEHNSIIWNKEIYEGTINVRDWDEAYKIVMYCNVILEAVNKIERNENNASEYDLVKGSALFFRSRSFLNLVMTFSKYYDKTTASTDLGIPLKLTADINENVTRSTVQQTYDRIVQDLSSASQLLPEIATRKTDASKLACFGLLARCYLFMDDYSSALKAANSSYQLKNYLIDFNTLNSSAARPVPASNEEVQIHGQISGGVLNVATGYSNIDDALYNSYSSNDLRKTIFFSKRTDGGINFKGNYTGTAFMFSSTATDEIVLIIAECKAILGDIPGGMESLNTLLIKRFRTGTFVPFSATNKIEALQIIRSERRKELIRRALRWQDLKRYNRDPQYAKTLTRTIDGVTYILPPNDVRYVIPIPTYIVQGNNLTQNDR